MPWTSPGQLEPRLRCLAMDLNLCNPCSTDSDCAAGIPADVGARCVQRSAESGSFCGLGCTVDAECPANYACRDGVAASDGAPVRQCVLADPTAECGCSTRAIALGAATTCTVRQCRGTRTCTVPTLGRCLDPEGDFCPVQVVVTLDARGGTGLPATTLTRYVSEPYGVLPEPTRQGHIFVGWWTAPDGTDDRSQVFTPTLVTRRLAHTLYASWVPKALNLCSPCLADADCTADIPADVGARCIRRSAEAGNFCGIGCGTDVDCPAGYACRDAVAADDGTTTRQCVLADSAAQCPCSARAISVDATTECALRSCYGTRTCTTATLGRCLDSGGVPCPTPVEVVVTLDPQGGTGLLGPTFSVWASEPYGDLPEPYRDGYLFNGWWTAPDGTEPRARVESTTLVTRRTAHTLYASWLAGKVYVTFLDGVGAPTGACEDKLVTIGSPYGALCTPPARTGYTFAGWVLDDGSEQTPVTSESIVDLDMDHALLAVWTPNTYTVAFDSKGGSPCPNVSATFGLTYGEAAGGTFCAPTRASYTFAGWYSRDDATGTAVTTATVVETPFDHSVFARWDIIIGAESCSGAIDEDNDGFVDCYDADCLGRPGCAATYPDDTCANATTVQGGVWSQLLNSCAYANNFAASAAGGCKRHGSEGDVIVKLVAQTAGLYRVTHDTKANGATGFDSVINVMKATTCPTTFNSCVAASDRGNPERVEFTAAAGETFWILADGYGTGCGVSRLTIQKVEAERCDDGLDNDGDGRTDCQDLGTYDAAGTLLTPGDCNGVARAAPLSACPFLDFRCGTDVVVGAMPFTNSGRNLCSFSRFEDFMATGYACTANIDPTLGGITYAYTAPVAQKVRVTATPRGTWFDDLSGTSEPIDIVLNLSRYCSPTSALTPCLATSDTPGQETADVTLAAGETFYAHVNLYNSPFGNDCGAIDLTMQVVP